MRADVALVLVNMGYQPDLDFVAYQEVGTVRVEWFSAQSMPSESSIDAYDMTPATVAARALAQAYTAAKALLTADDPISKKEKAFVMVVMDEFNLHANKINAILTAIDGAGTFAAMKTAIAAIQDYPQRTVAQLKTSISNKIDAGNADG